MKATIKEIIRTTTTEGEYHTMRIVQVNGTDKFKMTYTCYNANESLEIASYRDLQLNPLFDISDTGEKANRDFYIKDRAVKIKRANDLFKKAEDLIAALYA